MGVGHDVHLHRLSDWPSLRCLHLPLCDLKLKLRWSALPLVLRARSSSMALSLLPRSDSRWALVFTSRLMAWPQLLLAYSPCLLLAPLLPRMDVAYAPRLFLGASIKCGIPWVASSNASRCGLNPDGFCVCSFAPCRAEDVKWV